MDFIKLKELPRIVPVADQDSDSRLFKSFKKRLEQSSGIESDVTAICFSPTTESSQVAVACGSKVQLLDCGFGNLSETASWSKHKNIVRCLSFRNDGKLLIAGDGDGAANIYDVAVTRNIIRRLRGHDGPVVAVAFCSDKSRVATAGEDQTVKIWDVPTGQVLLNLTGHSDAVRSLVPVGENGLISAGADGKIIQWDLRNEGQAMVTVSHGHPIERLALFGSGAMFFSIGGGTVRLWDVRTMTEVRESSEMKHTKPVTSGVVSECGDFLATSSYDMTIKITRIATWEVVASFTCSHPVTSMAWHRDTVIYGLENGSWGLRQKRFENIDSRTETEAPSVTIPDETRYYKTNVIEVQSNGRPVKESNADYLLRKFEYRKLIDFLIESPLPTPLALAIVDELIQRGGLQAALRDRTPEELILVISWCSRYLVGDPRCSIAIVAQMLDTVVEMNSRSFACPQNEAGVKLVEAVKILSGKLSQEMTLQYKAVALAGLVESLISS
jgi:U3 small nucleolar RNA-associated protein 15